MSTLDQGRAEKGRRVALVIGVNGSPHYETDPLQFAVSDAKAMAQVLQEYGAFELLAPPLLGENATSSQIKTTLIEQTDFLGEDDFLLLYFAGHGHPQYVEAGRLAIYLVSADFKEQHIQRDENAHISMHWLRDQLFIRTKAAGVLIILDCCYAGGIDKAASDHYLDDLRKRLAYYFETPGGEVDMRSGSMRWALAATGYNQAAYERDGHGVLTEALLQALGGKVDSELDDEGQVTLLGLSRYLSLIMPVKQKPLLSGWGPDCVLAWHPERARELQQRQTERPESRVQQEKMERLRRTLADPGPVNNRLQWFVGRKNEFDDVYKKITDLRKTGGYLVITGEAGQGKSSLIAKLVEHFAQEQGGFDKVVYHFIPPRLQSNERAYLLREFLKRLIFKHPLSFAPDPSELGDSIPQMEELFQLVLQELVEKQRQEVIFIDGLDQLASHEDDLSFLPEDRMPGIVFVLGTRPDTLPLLEGMKPEPYSLPGLSFDNFILLLEKYRETGKKQEQEEDPEKRRAKDQERDRVFSLILSKASLLYESSKKYTLCLSVLARELYSQPDLIEHDVDEILTTIDPNPEHVFDLTMSRLERGKAWDTVTKPLLKLLLFAEEALTPLQLTLLLRIASSNSIDSYQVEKELSGHLSGLVVQQYDLQQNDTSKRYTLDHILLRNYLKKRFEGDQIECHRYFVTWCQQEALPHFWEDSYKDEIQERRRYARHYYITHLHHAYEWEKLFEVLDEDEGKYGQEKMREDPSGRSYRQDLTLGQDAAASCIEKMFYPMRQFARLWHYAFLRCSLNSRADNYSETSFRLLLHLGAEQERKARELAEMLTSTGYKACIFVLITSHLASLPGRQQEAFLWALRSEQLAGNLPHDDPYKADLLRKLAVTLKRIGRIQKGEQIQQKALLNSPTAHLDTTRYEPSIKDFIPEWLDTAMQSTGSPEAVQVGDTGASKEDRREVVDEGEVEALLAVCSMLQQGYWNGDESIWIEVEQLIYTLPDSIPKVSVLTEFASATEDIQREDAAGQIRWEIIRFVDASDDEESKDSILRRLVETLEPRRPRSETKQIWQNIENIMRGFADERKEDALSHVGSALARVGEFEQSWGIISTLHSNRKAAALADYLLCIRRANPSEYKKDVEALLNELSEENIRDAARIRLAAELGRNEFWAEAKHMITSISDESERCSAWLAHARALIQEGFFSAAKDILYDLPESIEQRWVLAESGIAWGESEFRREAAHTFAGEGEQVIRTLPSGPQKAWALAELAAIFARAHLWDKATEILQEAEEMVHTLTEDERADPIFSERWQQACIYYAIALVQDRRWQQLEQLSNDILPADSFIEVLAELAQETVAAEDLDNIARVIAQVVPDAKSTVPYNWKVLRIYARLSAAWKRKGDERKAALSWEIAEQLLSNAPLHERITAVGIYARALSETENNQEAEHLWRATERVIRNLPEKQEDALISFAMELVKAGRQEEAIEVLRSFQSIWRTIQALATLGTLFAQIGHRSQASLLFEEAAASLKKVARNEHIQEILEEMQRLLEQEGEWGQEDAIDHFLELARQLYRYGWREEAKQQLRKLEDFIQCMPDETRKREALFKLVETHGYIKNFLDINRIGEKFFSGIDKARFLALYGLLLVQAGRKQEAVNIIDTIVDQSTAALTDEGGEPVLQSIKKQAQEKLLKQCWQMRDWKYAQTLISFLDNEQIRDDARTKQGEILGRAYALHAISSQTGQEQNTGEALLAEARSVIDSIADVWKKFYALITLSENMASTEELYPEAKALCEKVEEGFSQYTGNRTGPLSGGEKDDEKKHRIEFRARLGIAYERMGERYKAEQLLQKAEKDILSLFWGEQEDQALEQLATAFLQIRNWQLAQEVINEIIDPTRKDRLLFDLTRLLMTENQWELAELTASSIRDDDPEDGHPRDEYSTDEPTRKEMLLFDLANRLLETGPLEAADRITDSIANSGLKQQLRANRTIADARARVKHASELEVQRWQEAQEEITSIDDQIPGGDEDIKQIKYEALSNLSYALVQAERFEAAEEVTGLINKEDTQEKTRCDIVDQLIEAQEWAKAERVASSIRNRQKQDRMLQAIQQGRAAQQATVLEREVQIDAGQLLQAEVRPARPIRREQERESRPPRQLSDRPEIPHLQQESARIQLLYQQWRDASTREKILAGFAPACTLISDYPELGKELWDAFQRVRVFLEEVSQRAT